MGAFYQNFKTFDSYYKRINQNAPVKATYNLQMENHKKNTKIEKILLPLEPVII